MKMRSFPISLDTDTHIPLLDQITDDLVTQKKLRWHNRSGAVQFLIENFFLTNVPTCEALDVEQKPSSAA